MRLTPIISALLLACAVPASAQPPAVAFPQVTGAPVPLQSISGRFSSLNPVDRRTCREKTVTGRVVTPRLVLAKELACGRDGHEDALVNIQFADPADAAQMVPGRTVTITAGFKRAEEDRETPIVAEFLIGERARIVSTDPAGTPAPVFTSYMICQPPELDALSTQLKSELCVQSTLVATLASIGPALEAAAHAPSRAKPEDDVPGDPAAISCRLEGGISDKHLSAIACARNSYWSWYKALHDPQFSGPAPV